MHLLLCIEASANSHRQIFLFRFRFTISSHINVYTGGVTVIIGIASFFYLPPSPTETASRFRGKDGWFSEREEIIMVNRVLRDDPGKVRAIHFVARGFQL